MFAPRLDTHHAAPALARSLAGAVLAMPRFEAHGALLKDVVARGQYRALPFELRFEQRSTRKSGMRPYTTIDLDVDAAGTPLYLGGAHVGYSDREAHVPFPQPQLADHHLVGAPRALLPMLANGPLGHRLARVKVLSLDTGLYAQRRGSTKRGIRLEVRGWPLDAASLAFLLDTVAELHEALRAAVPVLAGDGAWTMALLPEVVEHEAALERACANGRVVVAAVLAVAALFTFLLLGTVVRLVS